MRDYPAALFVLLNAIRLREPGLDELLKGCLKNDRKDQEKLYRRYFGLMYHICSDFVSSRDEILSYMNDGYFKIFKSLKQFDSTRGSFESWAKRIMINACIDHKRAQEKNISMLSIDDFDTEFQHNDPHAKVAEKEIMKCLTRMPEITQRIFNLYVFKGYSHKEISENMRIAESTSRWHVMEARRALKKISHEIL